MGYFFDVKQLFKHIATLYNSYLDIGQREQIDELKEIASNLELCSTVQNRDTIAVAGMQGTGKTTLVQSLYDIDEKILRVTQQQVADVLGLDRTAIAHYEMGDSMPNARNLQKICDLMNVTLDELLRC